MLQARSVLLERCLINSSPSLFDGNYNYVFGLLGAVLFKFREWMSVSEKKEGSLS